VVYANYLTRGGVRICQDPISGTRVSHDLCTIYIYSTLCTTYLSTILSVI